MAIVVMMTATMMLLFMMMSRTVSLNVMESIGHWQCRARRYSSSSPIKLLRHHVSWPVLPVESTLTWTQALLLIVIQAMIYCCLHRQTRLAQSQ
jgi:hypothetical protein